MNYVERHFGDWARDTAHLSMLEDGAYNRLCDLYYVRETPLPADLPSCCRLVRAVSKQERDAVRSVLQEFFHLTAEGWRHKRCDTEIDRFRTKSGKAAASARARWDKGEAHTERNANADANASTDAMRTHSEGNATRERGRARSHSPSTNHQTPEEGRAAIVAEAEPPEPPPRAPGPAETHKPQDGGEPPPEANGHSPTPAGAVCRAMRQTGLQALNPGDPRLLALLQQGATEAEFVGLAQEAVDKGKGFAWVLVALQARRAEAAAIALAAPAPKPGEVSGRLPDYVAPPEQTPEERARADVARKAAMQRLGRVAS